MTMDLKLVTGGACFVGVILGLCMGSIGSQSGTQSPAPAVTVTTEPLPAVTVTATPPTMDGSKALDAVAVDVDMVSFCTAYRSLEYTSSEEFAAGVFMAKAYQQQAGAGVLVEGLTLDGTVTYLRTTCG